MNSAVRCDLSRGGWAMILTRFPTLRICGEIPDATMEAAPEPSKPQLSVLPSATGTSMVTHMCGFLHSTLVTTPSTETSSFTSNIAREWWADSDAVIDTNPRSAVKMPTAFHDIHASSDEFMIRGERDTYPDHPPVGTGPLRSSRLPDV